MAKRVLSVGQCGPDTSVLRHFLERNFDARMDSADLLADAMQKLRAAPYDLVLVNRKLDVDYSDGMAILAAIKSDAEPAVRDVSVMLVSNYPEHQEAAVAAGAVYGFGKLQYKEPATFERLRAVLGARSESTAK